MKRITRTAALAGMAAAFALNAAPAAAQDDDRQFLYCVASAADPGGKAYFTKVYPGTWDQSPEDEEAYFNHIASKVDEDVERSTTYCYTLDTFDEAGLDREEGVDVIRESGWEPVEIAWRP